MSSTAAKLTFLGVLFLSGIIAYAQQQTDQLGITPQPRAGIPQGQMEMAKKQTFTGCLTMAQSAPTKAPASPAYPRATSPGTPQGSPDYPQITSPGTPPQTSSGSSQAGEQGLGSPSRGLVLKRQGTAQEIAVEGPATLGLSQHSGHMVQLSGTTNRKNDRDVLIVVEMKVIANSCDAKTGLGETKGSQ